ncbi:MAG: GMC family oxidoreductase N-terminal domain-containing protein [Gemmatimonadetes bacterium]|nr:GMC family oxidoreductase N-terminal domain-containing protein [Gemmatimonadota bacterium]
MAVPIVREVHADVVVVGSGAGGGTVAQRMIPLVAAGGRVVVLDQGPRLRPEDFTGNELDMASALFADAGGFLTADGTMTLAFGRAYGGSTVVYTGTSLPPPERVVRAWGVPGLEHADLVARAARYARENGVHLLPDDVINENNRLFVEGCAGAGYACHQFPVNVRGCRGSSLCNLGCPNGAKQGTHVVQLPRAEAAGVEVVTRAEALRLEERAVVVRVRERPPLGKGTPPEWAPGEYRVTADVVVLAGGAVGSSALLLRSGLGSRLPRLGHGFTCHPAFILVAEHGREITNDVGHPKSFYVDRAEEEGFVLETCMYFPFVTAKNLTGFGPDHERLMRAFPRLQMILVLACDKAAPGNRVEVDRGGAPRVRYGFTPTVRSSMVAATRAAARIFFAAGAERMHVPLADPPIVERAELDALERRISVEHFLPGRVSVSAAHLMGGCGMGRGASDSVTDHRGRVHGVPWLRVADSSLFPDSIEINPYLTIMALADRVAEGVLEEVA